MSPLRSHMQWGWIRYPVSAGCHNTFVKFKKLFQNANRTPFCGNMSTCVPILDTNFVQVDLSFIHTLVVVVTNDGCFCKKSFTTSGWSDWAARWIWKLKAYLCWTRFMELLTGFCPKSSVLSTPAPRLMSMSQAACLPAEAARCNGVCFF